jgi:hypothetical protein
VDLLGRGITEVFNVSEFRNPKLASLGYVLPGFVTGGISIFVFPSSVGAANPVSWNQFANQSSDYGIGDGDGWRAAAEARQARGTD